LKAACVATYFKALLLQDSSELCLDHIVLTALTLARFS